MRIKTLITLLPVLGAMLVPLNSKAGATAYSTITANIVPIASFETSGAAVFSGAATEHDYNGTVSLSTSGTDSAAKLKVRSSWDIAYDVSISLPAGFSGKSDNSLKIVDSHFTVNKGGLTEKGERELEFGGTLEMMNLPDSRSHSGPVYITTNFN